MRLKKFLRQLSGGVLSGTSRLKDGDTPSHERFSQFFGGLLGAHRSEAVPEL
jgi:hypothetical protein